MAFALCVSAAPFRPLATPFRSTAAQPARVPAPAHAGLAATVRRRSVRARGAGQEAVGSWLDLAGFVASSGKTGGHTPYDELADKIGRDVYIDVAGWHLYLKDVKIGGQMSLAQALAGQLGPKLQGQGFRPADLTELLKKVPIKQGGGKLTTSLADLLPSGCTQDLERICEDWARDA